MQRRDFDRAGRVLRGLSPRQGLTHRVLRAMIRLGLRIPGWRLEVNGMERLPRYDTATASADPVRPGAGCLIVVVPHRAWVEPFLLMAAWPQEAARPVWVGDGRTIHLSWWRRLALPRLGVIPIGPGSRGPRAYAELAAEALSRGAAVVIFPEKGPPSPPERTRTIAAGFTYLALRSGAPVVPVVVGGSHRIVRDVTFSLDVLEAIRVERAEGDPFLPEHRARVAELMTRYAACVSGVLVERTATADARHPARERWAWLGRLLR